MTSSNAIVKLAVVASSVLLTAGLIAYRSGAFDRFVGDKPTAMGGSKSKALIEPTSTNSQDTANDSNSVTNITEIDPATLMLMVGSKSDPGLVPVPSQKKTGPQTPATARPAGPTLMPSSKSMILLPNSFVKPPTGSTYPLPTEETPARPEGTPATTQPPAPSK